MISIGSAVLDFFSPAICPAEGRIVIAIRLDSSQPVLVTYAGGIWLEVPTYPDTSRNPFAVGSYSQDEFEKNFWGWAELRLPTTHPRG